MKRISVFIFILVMVISLTVVAENHKHMVFSFDTLSLYDGQTDNQAYVAYRGRVYDVSDVWSNGRHQGYTAGTDITESIKTSIHGTRVFDQLIQVGFLALNLWTIDELAVYHAQDDNPPYVAVDGIVYDVSETWPGGRHQGFDAGTDITKPIGDAPHGDAVLGKLPVMGVIVPYVLTDDELAAYNGQNGQPGYIAVNGIIYDVSETWATGSHRGFSAGNDITEEIATSEHGINVLGKLPIVGRMK